VSLAGADAASCPPQTGAQFRKSANQNPVWPHEFEREEETPAAKCRRRSSASLQGGPELGVGGAIGGGRGGDGDGFGGPKPKRDQHCQSASVGAHANGAGSLQAAQRRPLQAQRGTPISHTQPDAREEQNSIHSKRQANPIRPPTHVPTSGPTPGASMAAAPASSSAQVSGVNGKSMDQARYLYSTLTSNVTALLAASSASCAAPKSPSPTRALGVQRKQAQFVDRRQRQGRELCGANKPAGGPASLLPGALSGDSWLAAAGPSCRSAAGERRHSSSSSDHDDDELGAGRATADTGRRRTSSPLAGSEQAELDEEQVEADAEEEPLLQLRSAQPTPSIVESQFAETGRRRSSQASSQTSRSNSVDQEAAKQLQQQMLANQQHQLQLAMDPAMHALRAQGADLDTGNGNFIMATRRRRSVHAIHQAQLHQLQQQQQLAKHSLGSSGEQSASRCYKIDELHGSGSAGSLVQGNREKCEGPVGVLGGSRDLKSELRKLRATSSIDEAPSEREPHQRSRFVSEPSKFFASSHQIGANLNESAALYKQELAEPDTDESRSSGEFESERLLGPKSPPILASSAQSEQTGELSKEGRKETRLYHLTDTEYDLNELESGNSMLANLFDWNYPIFELAERYGRSILSKLSYRIFFDSGFFECK